MVGETEEARRDMFWVDASDTGGKTYMVRGTEERDGKGLRDVGRKRKEGEPERR